jgi:hypothetical protein
MVFSNIRWNYSPLKRRGRPSCRTAFSFVFVASLHTAKDFGFGRNPSAPDARGAAAGGGRTALCRLEKAVASLHTAKDFGFGEILLLLMRAARRPRGRTALCRLEKRSLRSTPLKTLASAVILLLLMRAARRPRGRAAEPRVEGRTNRHEEDFENAASTHVVNVNANNATSR